MSQGPVSGYTSGLHDIVVQAGEDLNAQTLIAIRTTDDGVSIILSINGYFAGGYTGARVTLTDRIVFSTGVTTASTVSNLSVARYYLAGISDGSTYGYFAGGSTGASVLVTDRVTLNSGVTVANAVSNLSVARGDLTAVSDSGTYGYFVGGDTGAYVALTDRITFSTGVTAANTISNLSVARGYLSGISDKLIYGYFAGGSTGNPVTLTDRITFSTGVTAANTVSNLSVVRYGLAGLSDNGTYGYFAGGDSGAGTGLTLTDRITFSTGVTAANTVSNLSVARYYLAGVSDNANYGYFTGGSSGGYVTLTDRITFSTGITAANTVSNLSVARSALAGLSDLAPVTAGGGRAIKASAKDRRWSLGITLNPVLSGQYVTARMWGIVTGFNNLTPGSIMYMDPDRPGGITFSPPNYPSVILGTYPAGPSDSVLNELGPAIGVAVTSSSIFFNSANTKLTPPATKGYAMGGYNGTNKNYTDLISFANEITKAMTSANINWTYHNASLSDCTTHCLVIGGYLDAAP